MGQREFGLRLKIDGDISDILGSLKRLQNAFDTVEMPDSLTKSLSKDITKAIQKVGEFGKKGEAAINSLADSKEVSSAWKGVTKVLESLQVKLDDIDPSKIFPKEVIANLEKAEKAAEKYNNAITDAKSSDQYKKKLAELDAIAERQRVVEAQSKKASTTALQAEEALNQKRARWTSDVNQQYEDQQKAIKDTNQAYEEQQKKVKELVELQKKLQEEGYLNSDKTVSSKRKSSIAAAKEALPEAQKDEAAKKTAQSTARRKVTNYEKTHADTNLSKDKEYLALVQARTKAEQDYAEALKRTKQLRDEAANADKMDQAANVGAEIAQAKELEKTLRAQAAAAKEAGSDLSNQKIALDNAEQAYQDAANAAKGYEDRLEELRQESKGLNEELKSIQTDSAKQEWEQLVSIIKEFTGVDLSQSAHDMQAVTTALDKYKEGKVKELPKILAEIVKNAKDAAPAVDRVGKEVREVGDDAAGLARADQEMENLKNQVLQFFSITNAIQLFKRAVTSALNTVKELDATMTEAAVVTEFDVGDMWEKLPQYSTEAQKLGVSINGMYQATTLYYQQGLKNQEAMELGIETMKMGKIASMNSTEATKAMTAALRGFNMELNQTSATKVNDVYSQLAAVTAADTNQIATAMEKTASIAASANMEFETTAALLAQIIETTQEAPETAGTALKTIIARFSEVKSLKEQGQTTGTDSEGEAIDVNKIQAALRTVGISMDGFFAGTEGLDSVLLKLSEKWSSLDFETQRYIATMAAGSRQQSRFIAMMSDYGRTTELVGQAQNSAGASQRQFEKTQESLATSLQRLENAWKQFLMGLANNDVIKFAVDTLTTVLTVINKIIDGISGGNGLIKAVTSLVGVIGALKLGKGVFSGSGAANLFGGLLGKGKTQTFKETVTESQTDEGNTVRTIVREPVKEGEEAGTQAGQGFVAGFKRAVSTDSKGMRLETMFTTGPAASANKNISPTKGIGGKLGQIRNNKIQLKHEKRARQKYLNPEMGVGTARKDFLGDISNKNKDTLNSNQYKEVVAAYDDMYKKTGDVEKAMDAAASKTKEFNGTLLDSEQTANMMSEQTNGLSLDMGALGGAVMGVGGTLGMLAALFESLGLEEFAEPVSILASVFMGLGSVMSLLSTIAPILGMSFTTAGVQITVAGVTSQLAWWWVFLIIAAVAALIVLIVALAKAAKENSLEGRMQAAAEATERAKEVAAEAKQAYEDLLSAKEGYDELQEQLDNLTKGTVEWKQALMESNQQVLELLQTYPELAKYLGRGEHGQLIISEEGWDKTIEQQEQAVKNASVGVMASQIAESRLQREKIEQDLNSDAFQAGITKLVQSGDYTYEITDTEDVEAIKKAYAEQGEELFRLNADGTFSQKLEDFALSIGQSAEEVYKLATSLGEYNSAVAENEAQLLGQAEAMLMAGTSAETMQYKYGEDVVSGMAKSVVGSSEQAEKDIAAKLYSKDGSSESENNEYFQQLMKENGLTSKDMTGDDKHDLEVLYAKMAGLGDDLSKIPDGLKGNKEALAKEIAKIQAGKDAVAQTETARKNMQKLDEQTQRRYAMAMSGDATKATRADVEAMKHIDIQKYAETMGYAEVRDAEGNLLKTAAQVMAEAQGIQDVYGEDGQVVKYAAEILADQVHNVSAGIEQEFAKIQEDAKRKGVSLDKSYLKEATAEQLSNYNELLSQALATGGKDGLRSLESSLGSILSQASQDQRDQILSSLGSFDFTQEGEADQFLNFLEGIGLYLPYDQIEKFTKDLQNLGNTFKHISLENVKTEVKDLLDLADSLEGREDSEGLSQEEYEKIIASGVATESQFAWNGQEWLYLDGPLDQLTAALKDNTAALLGKTKEQLQEQIDRGNEVEKILSHTQNGNVQGQAYNELYDTYYLHAVSQEDFLSNKVEDPSFLRNVFGLGSDMTDEQVMQYYKDSIFAYQNLNTNEQAMEVINNRANYMVDTNNINPMLDWGNTQSYEENVVVPDRIDYAGNRQWQRQQVELALEQETTVTKGGPTSEQQTQLKALAKEYGVSQATIDDFTKAMKTSNVEQRNAATTAIKNAIEQKKQEKQYGKTLGKLKTVGEEYSTVTKGMQGYDEVIRAYATALGTNDYDFVAENMELIQEAAQGNINSILELNRLLAQEHGLTITADGNFDLYNSKVDMANEATKKFLKSQYEAGAMRLVEITVDQKQEYLVPDGKGGFKMETFDVGQTVQVLQPADAASIERSLKTGGTGSGKSEPVDNPYDKYFNDLEKINDLLRERERLERAYQRLTRKGLRNVHELRRNQQQQLASIREENAMQRAMIANRTGQIQESIQKSKVSKYVQIETNQYGDKSPRIDWDAIDKVYKSGNEKEIEKIEKFLNENQGWLDDIYTREGTIEDNLDKEYELLQQGKEDYMSIEEQIKSAIETNAQKEIDKLSTVNDSINDTNSKLLESIQQQLDEYRQNRSNAKTEEELSDKQRRLAYLQQDTSGANSLEIMQLQEELEQGQEDYTDALIDQKINELQKQNNEAAAQRQQQIDILNDQLRHYIDSGEVWEKVNELLANAIDSEGNIKMDSELIQMLKEANGYDGLSEIGKLDWYKELLSTIANGFNWLKGDGLLASFWEGQKISFTTADGEEPITGTVNADGTVTTEDGHVYSNVRWNGGNNFSTTETTKKEEPIEEPETPALTEEIKKGVSKAIWNGGQGWGKGTERKNKLKEVFGENDIQKNYVDKKIYSGKASDYSYEKMKAKFKSYKTGGLADFTGPAWLDGTKSKPEYILNADQTKAFFTLVDVLSGLQTNTSKSAEKTGDNTYDIDINVESIGSDYDVEQIAATIKRLINEDARYRNNNTVNLMR